MVRDVMTTDLAVARPDTPFKDMVRVLAERRVRALPVVDGEGRLVGIVSETDLALKEEYRPGDPLPLIEGPGRRRERAKAAGMTAADYMTRSVAVIGPDASLSAAARLLHHKDVKQLPVVDPDGRLVGVVTRRDLLTVFLRPDDDIRYEIVAGVLDATLNLPVDAVAVDVSDGVVTLAGQVPRRSLAREIVELVNAIDGVVGVVDELTWAQDDTMRLATTPWG